MLDFILVRGNPNLKAIDIPKALQCKTLVIDGLNTFIRSWSTAPNLNENGDHIGGIVGTLKSIGYVRSNIDEPITPTLQEAMQYGMDLKFVGRNNFQEFKKELIQNNQANHIYLVDEGGYGTLGAQGAATILSNEKTNSYNHIICAVGTGTMMAGLISAAKAHQHITGIPVLKNEATIRDEINQLIPTNKNQYTLLHDFHLGGYAKTNQAQFDFMNLLWATEKIPTDMVYTSKLFMAVKSLMDTNYFSPAAKILIIHSGGLQGNRSLPAGTLLF